MNTMIRKALLGVGLLAWLAGGAQVMEKYPGYLLTHVSDNGRFLISENNGTTIIRDREADAVFSYGSNMVVGLGNAISNTGIAVGSSDNFTNPCFWQDGEWIFLNHDVQSPSIAMANAVTPDGHRIVGSIDCRSITGKAEPMVSPVVWTWDESAGDYRFEMLPEPATDITGCAPQQVSATFISDDGKTVLGQVTDYRGMIEYQVVFNEGDDGVWTCRTSGTERMQKEDAVWPPYPDRPVLPKAVNYLSEGELQAWDNAYQAYLDSLEIVPLTGKNPRMPYYDDFLDEHKAEFEEAMKDYEEKNESYLTDLYAFFDAYNANLTKHRFEFNSHRLSGNGAFYACNLVYPDPAPVDPDNVPTFFSPVLYALTGDEDSRLVIDESMGLYGLSNDGTMFVATPRSTSYAYSRLPYVIPPGGEPMRYTAWLRECSPQAYEWLVDNMSYGLDGEEADEILADGLALLAGTVRINSDASKIISYILEPETNRYVSYFIDLNAESDGVKGHESVGALGAYYVADKAAIVLTGDVDRVDIYDMAGRHVYGEDAPSPTIGLRGIAGAGVYVVRVAGGGTVVSRKIVIR